MRFKGILEEAELTWLFGGRFFRGQSVDTEGDCMFSEHLCPVIISLRSVKACPRAIGSVGIDMDRVVIAQYSE